MSTRNRSRCPISLSLELLGDRWTLMIIRDMAFAGKRHFREFLQSDEGVSSRTLAERLQTLLEEGVISRRDDPDHKLKAIYSLTRAGIDLLPVLVELGLWGSRHCAADPALGAAAARIAAGGASAMARMKRRLAREHLGPA